MEYKSYRIQDLVDIRRGASPRPIKDFISTDPDFGFSWVKIADATKDHSRFLSHTKEYVSPEGAAKSVAVYKGDLILSNSATPGLPKIMNKKAYIHDGWLLIRNFQGVNRDYLYYLFLFKRQELLQLSNGSVFNNLKTDIVKNFTVDIPSLNYQNRVEHVLTSIDAKIEVNNKLIANLEELSQTLFKRWFVDFEFPDEEGNPYKSSGGVMKQEGDSSIPIDWDIKSLETIMEITSGKRPKSKKDTKEENYTIPIIGASQTMGYTDSYLFDSRILVMGRVGTHGVIQRYITKCWPSDNTLVMHSIYYNFLYEFLNTVDYKSLNRGSTQPLLTQSDIRKLKLPLPNKFDKMDSFELELDPLLNMIFSLKIENNKLTNLRDTLLPKLMSGEIELPDELEVDEHAELL